MNVTRLEPKLLETYAITNENLADNNDNTNN